MNRDHYRTPPEVFGYMLLRYPITVDVAASAYNAVCPVYIDERCNALATPWDWFAHKGEYAWCNPPYSNIAPWIEAAAEAAKQGIGCVMLVMLDQSVGWFLKALESCQEVVVVTGGRIAFRHPVTGLPVRGNTKGSMFLIWHPYGRSKPVTKYLERRTLLDLPPKRDHTEQVLDMVE